jgi:hypothetical protein
VHWIACAFLAAALFTTNICLAPAGSCIVGAHPTDFVLKNLHIIGTKVGSMRDTDAAMGFAARVSAVRC